MGKLTLVAVYGTLKRGYENYDRLLAGERPVLEARLRLPYRMYANDEYPMLVPEEATGAIDIEVFAVSESKLEELDALELPYGYRRESVYVSELGEEVEIYVHDPPAPEGFEPVPSGDWRG